MACHGLAWDVRRRGLRKNVQNHWPIRTNMNANRVFLSHVFKYWHKLC